MYPGAVTIMIPRMIFAFLVASTIAIFLTIFMIGHDRRLHMNAVRSFLCRAVVRIGIFFFGLAWFTILTWRRLTPEQVGFYEEYLGPVEEQRRYHSEENTELHPHVPKRGPGPSSTLVCNHCGWMEILNQLVSPVSPCFTPKAAVKKVPVASTISDALQSLYV